MENTESQIIQMPSSDEKTMAILAHVLTIVGGFIAPLVIFLVKKDESVFVREHAKESLNFQITMFIGFVISVILTFILIGVLLMAALVILNIVMVIMATIKASEGSPYQYPFNIRFIK